MKLSKHVLWGLCVAVVVTCLAVAGPTQPGSDAPPPEATAGVSQGNGGDLAVDPFAGRSEISTSALEPVAYCPCLIGYNCCGDEACSEGGCGSACHCYCGATGFCIKP